MTREYLRVTPTSAGLDPDVVSTVIASLHKLSVTDSGGVITRMTPFRSEQPVTFEFLAISDGTNEPVEFYYGADTKLDVLEQRLRSIYPDSFDIDRVDIDIVQKLIQPVEQRPAEFDGGLEEERFRDPDAVDPPTDRNPPIDTDGGTVRARLSLEDVTPYGVRW
ncbi:MAG: ATP-binding protein, partial [Halobacteriales archaeon]